MKSKIKNRKRLKYITISQHPYRLYLIPDFCKSYLTYLCKNRTESPLAINIGAAFNPRDGDRFYAYILSNEGNLIETCLTNDFGAMLYSIFDTSSSTSIGSINDSLLNKIKNLEEEVKRLKNLLNNPEKLGEQGKNGERFQLLEID